MSLKCMPAQGRVQPKNSVASPVDHRRSFSRGQRGAEQNASLAPRPGNDARFSGSAGRSGASFGERA
jgi:hypothetical protein